METVLITGGSGIIGTALSKLLEDNNYAVRHLSRSIKGNEKYETYVWDLSKNYVDPRACDGIDHIIHLAGENVGSGRWTASRKERILSSRIDTLSMLRKAYEGCSQLKSFLSASGISYYGSVTTPNIFKEEDPSGSDYLADVSVKWEAAAQQFADCADRIAIFRTGVVLSPTGGALEALKKPISLGVGSPIGTGKQYMPWLHLDDICGMYLLALKNTQIKGIYNAVATPHVTNKEMTQAIAKQLDKKLWAPNVPAFAVKLLFGEMSIVVLEGSRMDNSKIKEAGYQFVYPELDGALADLLPTKNK